MDGDSHRPCTALLEQRNGIKRKINGSVGLQSLKFKELWSRMLTRFTKKFLQILRLVALMLLIPIDTSECERLFSIINDIKDANRSRLGSEVLKNLITWYYYALR